MTVRFFPGSSKRKTSLIEGFLNQFRVQHELVLIDNARQYTRPLGAEPAVEVNGRLFIDPNVDALKKILQLEDAA